MTFLNELFNIQQNTVIHEAHSVVVKLGMKNEIIDILEKSGVTVPVSQKGKKGSMMFNAKIESFSLAGKMFAKISERLEKAGWKAKQQEKGDQMPSWYKTQNPDDLKKMSYYLKMSVSLYGSSPSLYFYFEEA